MTAVLCLVIFTLSIFGPVATTNGAPTEPENDANTHVDDSDYFRLLNAGDGEARFHELNPKYTDDGEEIVEGDIVLTKEQKGNRKAVANLWPSGIVPFAITSSSSADRWAIIAGINHWRAHTCLRFNEVSENYRSGPHIRFYKGPGCFSKIGRIYSSSGQNISIGVGCASVYIVAHEIGHAIGFRHEQSRPDRDSYVRVLYDNITPGKEYNFNIDSNSRTHGVQYDYTSIMHYHTTAFSANGRATLLARSSQYNCLLGSGRQLSHYDKRLANVIYNCAGGCSSRPYCYNGGFVNKYCKCQCPRGTYFRNCFSRYANYCPSC